MIISSFFKSRLKHDGQIKLLLLFNVLYTVLDVSSLEISYYTLCWMLHLLKSLISLSHTLGLSPLGYMWFDLALVSCYSLKYDVNVATLSGLIDYLSEKYISSFHNYCVLLFQYYLTAYFVFTSP